MSKASDSGSCEWRGIRQADACLAASQRQDFPAGSVLCGVFWMSKGEEELSQKSLLISRTVGHPGINSARATAVCCKMQGSGLTSGQ